MLIEWFWQLDTPVYLHPHQISISWEGVPPFFPCLPSTPQKQPLIFFHIILVLPILRFHISGNIIFINPFVSTSFLNIVFVRFSHVVACIRILIHPFYWQVVICQNLFTQLLVDGHLSCFPFLAIVNKAAVNILVQNFLWPYIFLYLG